MGRDGRSDAIRSIAIAGSCRLGRAPTAPATFPSPGALFLFTHHQTVQGLADRRGVGMCMGESVVGMKPQLTCLKS
jgi:hypothetical protein